MMGKRARKFVSMIGLIVIKFTKHVLPLHLATRYYRPLTDFAFMSALQARGGSPQYNVRSVKCSTIGYSLA